eukprot:691358_1
MIMTQDRGSFLRFGRYEGVWKNDTTGFECALVIDENNFKPHALVTEHPYAFEGFLEWRSTVIPDKFGTIGIDKLGLEKVRGFYFNYCDNQNIKANNNHQLICMGYEVYQSVDPNASSTTYSCDGYKFDLNPCYQSIDSFACNLGQWDTPINIKRVASKHELIELLTVKFGNERGIVGIVSSMLHAYTPPTIALQDPDSNDYKVNLRVLLSYQNAQLKPLFADIFEYESETKIRVIRDHRDDDDENLLEVTVGDECIVIYTSANWCLAICNDGQEKDIKTGWISSAYFERIDDVSEQSETT